jgi:hypothetical protein
LATLGQPGIEARPLIPSGPTDWQTAKAFWFKVFGYKIYAPEVLAFHESQANTRIVSAPARSSKSHSAAHDALVYGMPTDPPVSSLHWSIGPTYETNREFQEWWRVLIEQRFQMNGHQYKVRKKVNNPANGAMEIQIEWGRAPDGSLAVATFKGMSATNPESLQGEEVTTCIMSEAAEQPEQIYTKYVESRTWKVILPTTPKQKAQWIKRMIDDGRANSATSIENFIYTGYANPFYNWERFEAARQKALMRARETIGPHATEEDEPYFAEQFLGHWKFYTGAVLPFSREKHVVAPGVFGVKNARICVSVDYGYEDPAVALFWMVLPDGLVVVFDEIYDRHLSTDLFVEAIQDKLSDHRLRADWATGDPSRPEVERIMRDAGLRMVTMDKNAQRDRAAGHRHLVDVLLGGPHEGFPGLYLTSDCRRTIEEWELLHYKERFSDEYGQTALSGADHAYDAARYFIQARAKMRPPERTKDEIKRWQSMRRRERLDAERRAFDAVAL